MLQFLANGFCKGAVIALVGLGFGLIYTTTKVFHLAHAAIYAVAAYALFLAMGAWRLPAIIGIPFALLVAAAAGLLIEIFVYRPLAKRSASAAVVLISSLGVYIVLINVIAMAFGNQTQILRPGIEKTFAFGSVILTRVQLAQALVGLLLTGAFWMFLRRTRIGQICRAVADDDTLASVLGIEVGLVRLWVFALGSVLAGSGAVLVALDVGMDPHFGFSAVLAAAVACIIGGLRNFLAPAAGGLLLGLTQALVIWQTSARWESAVTFGLLIVFLLVRRQGLFGVVQRMEER